MFGPDSRLVGMLTSPAEPPEGAVPAVVILNAGIIHRVGPGRLHVRLARQLAATGHTVLRFDLSGIGDSAQHPNVVDYAESVLDDCRHAIDQVLSTGGEEVLIFGLCSGADNGFRVAGDDPRVKGLILVDPTLPPTRGYRMRWWTRRVASPTSWRNLIVRRSGFLARLRQESGRRGSDADAAGGEAARAAARAQMQELVARGVSLCCLFTGGQEYCNYRRQLLDVFPDVDFGEQLRLEYWPECTHVFLSEQDKKKLLGTVLEWVAEAGFDSAMSSVGAAGGTKRRGAVAADRP